MADFLVCLPLARINYGTSPVHYHISSTELIHLTVLTCCLMAGPAVTALATSFCIQSSQVAPSPNIHLIVFVVACISPLHLHLYHSCGILGRKAMISFSFCLSLFIYMSQCKAVWRRHRLGIRNSVF